MLGISLVGCGKAPIAISPLTGNLVISVARTITAGQPVVVTIGPTAASNSTPVTLLVVGSYGPRIYQASFHNKMAHVALPGKETQQSGVVTLTALAGQAQGSTQMLINPSNPAEPLTPLIGARAIIADTYHWSMTVVVPFDTFGNPVREGTRVELLVLHPGNHLERKMLVIHYLLVWTRIFSGTKAGRTTIVARIGSVHGFEGRLLEVAGWPVPFDLSAEPLPLPADGRLLTTLHTAVIRDQYGNVIPDGTLITFIIDTPDGTRSYIPAQTIGGIASAPLQAPRKPGDYNVHATVFGVMSNRLIVHFTAGPVIGTFPISVQKDPVNKGYIMRAGPMLASLGQYIPDGTPVRFIITNAAGRSHELDDVSDAGYAQILIRATQFPRGVYHVQIIVGAGVVSSTVKLT